MMGGGDHPTPTRRAAARAGWLRSTTMSVACLLGALWSTQARSIDGNKLLELCTSTAGATYYQDQAFCAGYFQAINDSLITFELVGVVQNLTCIPKQVSLLQMRDVALRYISTRPDVRHTFAASQVLAALKQAFPCTHR